MKKKKIKTNTKESDRDQVKAEKRRPKWTFGAEKC